MRPRTRLMIGTTLVAAMGISGCDSGASEGTQPAPASVSPPAPAAATTPAPMAVPSKVEALPKDKLDAAAFVTDPCTFASAEQVAAFLPFVEGKIEVEKGEQRDRGRCVYKSTSPELALTLWFADSVRPRSSEVVTEIAGVQDVRLRTLSYSAELVLPFAAARDSSKQPASRIYVRLNLYEHAQVEQPFPGPPKPIKADLETAMRAVGENLAGRLPLE